MHSIFKLTVLFATCLCLTANGCGGGGATSQDGKSCTDVGAYMCADNVTHLCRFDGNSKHWEAKQDCGASSTANCQCVILLGLGTCGVAGSSDNLCKGEYL